MKSRKIISILMGLLLSASSLLVACTPANPPTSEAVAIVEDIAVKTLPKSSYILGEEFEISGGVLELIYEDGTTGTVDFSDEKVKVSVPDMTTIGKKTVTVEYDGFETTYTIIISELSYTVTFDYNYEGAPEADENTVGAGESATPIVEPTRQGFRFLGWFIDKSAKTLYDFEQPVSSDLTLYAGWVETRTVTFDLNYDSASAPQFVTVDAGTILQESLAPEAIREGYIFDGWHTDKVQESAYDFTQPVTQALTLYAHWREKNAEEVYYEVTFDYNYSGYQDKKVSVLKNDTVTEPQPPTVEGRTFLGWFTEEEGGKKYDFTTKVSGNVTLYAHWQVEYYSVVFKYVLNGKETVVRTRKVEPGEKVSVGTLPVLEGYRFVGNWYTDKECTKLFDFDSPINDDYTLYIKPLKENKFEAEYTYIDESKPGFGSSDNFSGLMLIFKDNGSAASSNGYWVSGLYYKEAFIEFIVTAEEEVSNAVLDLGLSAEWADAYIAPETQNSGGVDYYGYEIAVWKALVDEQGNAKKDEKGYTLYDESTKITVDYAPIAITGAITFDESMVDKRPFTNYTMTTSFRLYKGVNVIRLTVKNDHAAYDGTMKATAPMVDYLTVYTDVPLVWTPKTENLDDPSKINGGLN